MLNSCKEPLTAEVGFGLPVAIFGSPLERLIDVAEFDWVNPDMERHFSCPSSPARRTEIHLFHFGRVVESEEVLRAIEEHGFRPADLRELVCFAGQYQEEQRRSVIAALGSAWRGRVPALTRSVHMRTLDHVWYGYMWHSTCRFAALRA